MLTGAYLIWYLKYLWKWFSFPIYAHYNLYSNKKKLCYNLKNVMRNMKRHVLDPNM